MRLRKAAKRHFVDPSLALAATGASAERLLEDVAWFGQVLHYRDDYGIEVDAAARLTGVSRRDLRQGLRLPPGRRCHGGQAPAPAD